MYLSYFEWLRDKVEYFTYRGQYDKLFQALHHHDFEWQIAKDENRMLDGRNLRNEYFEYGPSNEVIEGNVSFLEFLVGLSIRMGFIYSRVGEDQTRDCFWMLMANLELDDLTDDVYDLNKGDKLVARAVRKVNRRDILGNGAGGLFPLKAPRNDQRNVEIWYQMNAYLIELMKEEEAQGLR